MLTKKCKWCKTSNELWHSPSSQDLGLDLVQALVCGAFDGLEFLQDVLLQESFVALRFDVRHLFKDEDLRAPPNDEVYGRSSGFASVVGLAFVLPNGGEGLALAACNVYVHVAVLA